MSVFAQLARRILEISGAHGLGRVHEVARLWALYPPGSFAPTLAVTAGPVVIDSTLVAPPTYPVRTVGNSIRPSTAGPRLDTIAGPDGIGAPIRATSAPAPLTLRGAGFCAGGQMDALIDGVVAPTTVVDDGEIAGDRDADGGGILTGGNGHAAGGAGLYAD